MSNEEVKHSKPLFSYKDRCSTQQLYVKSYPTQVISLLLAYLRKSISSTEDNHP